MKNIAVLLLVALAHTLAPAQSLKGRLMVNLHNYAPQIPIAFNLPLSGNMLGFTVRTEEFNYNGRLNELKTSQLGASISAHYFWAGNLSAGVNLSGSTFSVRSSLSSLSGRLYTAGPELRAYLPVGWRTYLWASVQAAWGRMLYNDVADMRIRQRSLGVGAAFFLKDYLSFNIGLAHGGYRFRGAFEGEEEAEFSSRGLTFDLGVSLFFR
ncbi:MAG: hypothetical protein RMJ33_11300 [Saprospiraceae bacterium]|nr:hypothetical protein [Saprospiraceae bacterium]MDW8230414.1 hypothetical protein [Saprospiraceae bacterium]